MLLRDDLAVLRPWAGHAVSGEGVGVGAGRAGVKVLLRGLERGVCGAVG